MDVHKVSRNWNPTGESWGSFSSALGELVWNGYLTQKTGQWAIFDVTWAVRDFQTDPARNFGFQIAHAGGSDRSFATSDTSAASCRPKLVITPGPMLPRPSVTVPGAQPGLHYAMYEGSWSRLPDFNALRPAAEGTVRNFSVAQWGSKTSFGVVFTGYITIPADGVYRFSLASDDGSQLLIGDKAVVMHDGIHGSDTRTGKISLQAGKHPIRVEYFNGDGGLGLSVTYGLASGTSLNAIADAALSYSTSPVAVAMPGASRPSGGHSIVSANGGLQFSRVGNAPLRLTLLTVDGKAVHSVYTQSSQVALRALKPGLYVLRGESADGTQSWPVYVVGNSIHR